MREETTSLLNAVAHNPGLTTKELCAKVGLSREQTNRNLLPLMKEKRIRRDEAAQPYRYYLYEYEGNVPEKPREEKRVMKSHGRELILETVKAFPKSSIKQIAEVTGLTYFNVRSNYIPAMLRMGMLSREATGTGRHRHYLYSEGDGTPVAPDARKRKSKGGITDAGLQARYDQLLQDYEELVEWKAAAIARYPELKVKPVVLRAREIVARTSPEHKDAVMRGALDEKPIMLATIAALEDIG